MERKNDQLISTLPTGLKRSAAQVLWGGSLLILVIVLACVSTSCGKTTEVPTLSPSATLSVSETTPPPTPTLSGIPVIDSGEPLPPQVIGQNPPVGQTASTTGNIEVIFDQPMDQQATGAAILVSDLEGKQVKGEITWPASHILTFSPSKSLKAGTSYVVNLTTEVKSQAGLQLSEPLTWQFDTVGELQIVEVFPGSGASEVEAKTTITVIFNRPVVPLVVAEKQEDLPSPIEISPPVTGQGEWVNTSVYAFQPQGVLQGGMEYVVTIKAGLTDATGESSLTQDYQWSFTTITPGIASYWMVNREWEINPSNYLRNILLDQAFAVSFYQPMNIVSVEDSLSILSSKGEPNLLDFSWNEDASQVVFTPTHLLAYDTQYTLNIRQDAQAADGGKVREGLSWNFTTIQPPVVLSTNPPNGSDLTFFMNEFYVSFASPMDLNSLKDKVVFSPPLESDTNAWWYDDWWYDEWYWRMTFYGLQPSTQYEVRILPGMKDIYGSEITEEVVIRFTNAPYEPSAYLQMPYGPVLYRVGGVQEFYASYRNVDEVTFELFELSTEDFIRLQNGTLSQWDYRPAQEDLVWEITQPDNSALNQRILTTFTPTIGEGGPIPPGFYLLGMTSPQVDRSGSRFNDSRLIMIATANITFKNTKTETLVWLTDLETGTPLGGVNLTIYDETIKAVAEGVTDENGLFYIDNLPGTQEEYYYYSRYVIAQRDGQFAFAANFMESDVSLYDYGIWSDYYAIPKQPTAYVYSERPIYRPGQPVYFKGIVRINDDLDYSLPDLSGVEVRIESYEETVYQKTLQLSDYGTFDGELLLDINAALGSYTLNVYLPDSEVIQPDTIIGSVSFNVAEYRKPEFQVNVTAGTKYLLPGQSLEVEIQADYYSGGHVANAEVSWVLMADTYTFTPPPEFNSYSFSDYEADYSYYSYEDYGYPGSQVIAEGIEQTDATGKLIITLPAELSESGSSRQLTLEATVSDLAGTAVSGRDSVIVHRSSVYPGVRPGSYVGSVGEDQSFDLVTVDWYGAPIPGQLITVDIVERRWYSVQEQDAQGRIIWTSSVEDIPVVSFTDMDVDEEGKATVTFNPDKGGIYRAVVTVLDEQGNSAKSSAYLWVAGEEYIPWRQGNDHGFELIPDKEVYEVGDTAEIMIASPFQGETYALVTLERGHIRSYEVVLLTNNSTIYSLPITNDMAPNIYVFVTIIKGLDDTNPRPDFRIGLAQLQVDSRKHTLNIELIPDRTEVGPGEQIGYVVRTTDWSGNPVSAEVSLSLSDLATLSLSPPNSQLILDHFYGARSLSVWTAMPLVYSVEYYNFELAQEVEQGAPVGSGGGKGSDEFGVIEVREEFPDTAFWQARLVTDANGEATISVTLPDNLTTWRMDARAVSEDTLVGQATNDIVSTKMLLVRPQTPRFFVAGDQVTVGAAVHNNTGSDLSVDVTLNGEGIILEGNASHTVEIPAGQQAYISWNVAVLMDAERVDLVFSAEGGEYSDASRPTLGTLDRQGIPVYRYEVQETVGTSGQLLEGGTIIEAISLPTEYEVQEGELVIEVAPSLAAGMTDGLKFLEHYPYECIEQTISRFLPNVVTTRALRSAGMIDPELEAGLEVQVNTALQRLYNWQNPDGGWGWWSDQKSDPLTSAYVILGLVEAHDTGFEVSEDVIMSGVAFLKLKVRPVTQHTSPSTLNLQAFILYTLARTGNSNVSKTVQLYEYRQAMALYGRAFLLRTLYEIDPQDTRIDTLLSDINTAAILSATGTHWEEAFHDLWNWNTDIRTTAIVLSVLSEIDPSNPLNANAVRWLMSHRTNGHWQSTQETAWTLMALTNWMTASGELDADYEYAVGLNGDKLGGGIADSETLRQSLELRVDVTSLVNDQANRLAFARSEGKGNLYYTAHLKVFLPVERIKALDRGIVISRSYYLVDDTRTIITQASLGDLLLVQLTIVAPHDLHYVLIEDPLPAGLEAVDQSLLTSPQAEQPQSYAYNDLVNHGWGWWYFNHVEMRDEKVVLSSDYLPAGTYIYTYMARASTPGIFRVIPPTAQEFYFPEVYGRGEGSLFEVNP